MTTDLDSDSELRALRNELLTGLQKKRNSFETTTIDAQEPSLYSIKENGPRDKAEEDEDELEMLRMQALNAKKSRDNGTTNMGNSSSSHLKAKSNLVPGRFRYDKDSDEEEEDDDEEEDYGFSYERRVELYDKHETFSSLNDINNEDMNNKTDNEYNNHEQYFHNDNNQYKDLNNNDELSEGFKSDYSSQRNYQNNYQTYRAECSKLISNEEYDPNSLPDHANYQNNKALPQDFDLRNFLRQKNASQQQQQESDRFTNSNGNTRFYTDYTNPDDVVYSEPITRPIEITNNFMHNRAYRHHRSYNRLNSHSSLYANSGEKTYNNKRQKYTHEDEANEDASSLCDSESDEEENFLNNKKLRSVIVKAVISTDTTKSEVLNTSDGSRSQSRDHSRNRQHHRRK